jgi:hypothetical protein
MTRVKIEPLTTSTIESQEEKLISIPSWSVQLTLGNQPESTLHTCLTSGKSILRQQSEHSMWSPNSAKELTARSYQETTVPSNDRMLQYRRIAEYFFMHLFFATKKAGKLSRGHTCCQLFVTDKGFVYVVPMKSKAEVLQAVKQFAKEIGAPDAIICDLAGEQTYTPSKVSAMRSVPQCAFWRKEPHGQPKPNYILD